MWYFICGYPATKDYRGSVTLKFYEILRKIEIMNLFK